MFFTKLAVYLLIIANLSFYVVEDWTAAQYALTADATLLDILGNYASSLDDFAWIGLLLIFEVETWWLEDDFDNRLVEGVMHALKVLFLGMILHTSYTYITSWQSWFNAVPLEGVTDLCSLTSEDLSVYRNLGYTPIDAQSCAGIPHDGKLYRYPGEPLVTDATGLAEDKLLRIADLVENLSWLLIVVLLQAAVHLQNREVYSGPAIAFVTWGKLLGYGGIVVASAFWISKGHYVYAWDEFLWIAGFMLLERNLSAWRSELADEHASGNDNGGNALQQRRGGGT